MLGMVLFSQTAFADTHGMGVSITVARPILFFGAISLALISSVIALGFVVWVSKLMFDIKLGSDLIERVIVIVICAVVLASAIGAIMGVIW